MEEALEIYAQECVERERASKRLIEQLRGAPVSCHANAGPNPHVLLSLELRDELIRGLRGNFFPD
jgi:hypothetical protein